MGSFFKSSRASPFIEDRQVQNGAAIAGMAHEQMPQAPEGVPVHLLGIKPYVHGVHRLKSSLLHAQKAAGDQLCRFFVMLHFGPKRKRFVAGE